MILIIINDEGWIIIGYGYLMNRWKRGHRVLFESVIRVCGKLEFF